MKKFNHKDLSHNIDPFKTIMNNPGCFSFKTEINDYDQRKVQTRNTSPN